MIYGFIIAAGNQSRFDSDIPKALIKINNSCLLDKNVENMSRVCDRVYVVCSTHNYKYFEDYNSIVIDSGYGCGDAVMKALNKIDFKADDTCFVQWGDSYQLNNSIYNRLIDNYRNSVIIPCEVSEKPYVQILENDDKVKVLFSKYNEQITKGYHDLSLFYGNSNNLKFYLNDFHDKIYLDGKYTHKHNNEMQFLDVFNDTDIKASILYLEDCKSFSFNTKEELKNILGELKYEN